jgi:uncharacterized membrane protein
MAVTQNPAATMGLPGWVRWARVPLQLPLIWWVSTAMHGQSGAEADLKP